MITKFGSGDPPDHRETVRVRLVTDAVQAHFVRERAVLEGA